jgi:omega-6 fatty acid desaturase (delta-12 desaturase)
MFVLGLIYYIFIHNRIPFIKFKGWEKERLTFGFNQFIFLAFFPFWSDFKLAKF